MWKKVINGIDIFVRLKLLKLDTFFPKFEHFYVLLLSYNELAFFAANFALPQAEAEGEETPTPLFKEIIFTELDREEAAKVVEEYNKVPKYCQSLL